MSSSSSRFRDNLEADGDGLHKFRSSATSSRYHDDYDAEFVMDEGDDDDDEMQMQAQRPYSDDPNGAPTESFQISHSLPTPEEIILTERVHSPPSNRKRCGDLSWMKNKKLLLIVTFSVFALTATIGLIVSVAARNSSRNVDAHDIYEDVRKKNPTDTTIDDLPNSSDSGSGSGNGYTPHPDAPMEERFRAIANYLAQFQYIDVAALTTATSAQHLAALWMAHTDPAALSIPASTDYDDAKDFVQRYVLAVFYYATGGDQWSHDLGFLSGDDTCDWFSNDTGNNQSGWPSGVQCDDNGEVNYIFIPENNLSGFLPDEMGLLVAMEQFSVYGNNVGGTIPTSLETWTDVLLFAVEDNLMTGTLPAETMAAWTKLQFLAVGNNDFTGALPDVFRTMPDLLEVSAHDNSFTGTFDRFNDNTKLKTLMLQRNKLTGDIQAFTFINVPLELLDMSHNSIGGTIPYDFYDVKAVSLHHNQITGPLPEPSTEYEHLIHYLSVFDNQMSGDLPENLGALVTLRHLDLSFNQFEGVVPASLANCVHLHYLYLGDNDFLAREFPDLSTLTRMTELSLRNINMNGSIPDWLGNSLTGLVYLDLRFNQLGGNLPLSLENLESARYVLLSHNALTGGIPDELWWMQKLRVLGLDHNKLEGPIGDLCMSDGPAEMDWIVADDTVECSCCSDQCASNGNSHTSCGGDTLLSPNIEDGYERTEFVFNAQLIFEQDDDESSG